MATIMNGLALYGGLRAYGGTFLVFSDYMRNGIRLSALMKLPVTYVLTHDSIGLGEDGSTHQPIEQIASLRLIPNLHVWRPCDQQETLVAWRSALNQTTPTVLALSRQNLPEQKRSEATRKTIAKGGYILEAAEKPDLVLVATGSEVALATAAAAKLREEGLRIQVVSMPCLKACRPSSSKRALPCRGAASAVTAAPSSASTPSANPPRLPNSSRCSVSPSKTSSPKARRCSKKKAPLPLGEELG